jgi:hypothetical protein
VFALSLGRHNGRFYYKILVSHKQDGTYGTFWDALVAVPYLKRNGRSRKVYNSGAVILNSGASK